MTKIVIKAADLKPALGHQSHASGSGVHQDRRTKRNRTRHDVRRKAILEQS
jgi:hypothetical protein